MRFSTVSADKHLQPTASILLSISLLLTSPLSVMASTSIERVRVPGHWQQMAQNTWQPVSLSEGRFSVEMPGQPELETWTNEQGFVEYSLQLEVAEPLSHYFIHYFDEPKLAGANEDELAEVLRITLEAFIEGAEAELLSQQNIELNRYPGKAFEFHLGIPNTPRGKGQIFIVQERLYILVVLTPRFQDAERFLRSFRLF